MPFRDIRGHRRLTDLLARSIERGALPPASIFAGPSADKRATALAVAQALNCLEPRTQNPEPEPGTRNPKPGTRDACGTCAACTRIARGVHPDVLVVEPGDSGNIKLEPIRDAIDRTGFKPFEGRRRAVIIDEADAMIPQAQNALLKTLEEPPPSSVFILVTSRPDSLLPTVRSRCIRLWFAEAGATEVDAEARAVAERVLARAADGNDAARLDAAAKELHPKSGGIPAAVSRELLASQFRAMASLLRDAEIVATGADARALANPDVRPILDRLAAAFRGERGVRAFAAVDQGLVALDRNAGVKVVADWVALQL
jgi:DNA polymerase-3 subunit delta'